MQPLSPVSCEVKNGQAAAATVRALAHLIYGRLATSMPRHNVRPHPAPAAVLTRVKAKTNR
jgi:hypothetical protein